jgi:hypothetical protein
MPGVKMRPVRFRIKTIMLVIAMVGLSLSLVMWFGRLGGPPYRALAAFFVVHQWIAWTTRIRARKKAMGAE